MKTIKIAIIGDFNYTYNTHHATNIALDQVSESCSKQINYYWIRLQEFEEKHKTFLSTYDAFLINPGPFKSEVWLKPIIEELLLQEKPVLITGDAFSVFMEILLRRYHPEMEQSRIISDNLLTGNHCDTVYLKIQNVKFQQIYQGKSAEELTTTRFSVYPEALKDLKSSNLEIVAINQFGEAEIASIKDKSFFVACAFCPQISSTRNQPHPLLKEFISEAEKQI